MSISTLAIPTATVIPLQRAERERPRHRAAWAPEGDAAHWDTVSEALFHDWRPVDQHGRHCACTGCGHALAAATEVAS